MLGQLSTVQKAASCHGRARRYGRARRDAAALNFMTGCRRISVLMATDIVSIGILAAFGKRVPTA